MTLVTHIPLINHQEDQTVISGKASGADSILSEPLKANLDWCATLLASLLALFNHTVYIPDGWGLGIIDPVYKKGSRSDPVNYHLFNPANQLTNQFVEYY